MKTRQQTIDMSFSKILREVLNKRAPVKGKYLRANDSPFMTKHLRKLIMNRSRSKNTYVKNRTAGNWENYRVLRNKCTKESINVKKEYFCNINIKLISDNKTCWKTVKPNFTNKNKTQKIILVENEKIICDNKQNAEIFNDYFVNIVKDLNIPDISSHTPEANHSVKVNDPIDINRHKFSRHPSITKIKENVNQTEFFTFQNVNEPQIEK